MKIKDDRLVGNDGKLVPWIASPNVSGKFKGGKPRFLIMHYTAGGNDSGAITTLKNPAKKVSAHFVVGHDGAVTQMVKLDTIAWHAGVSRWKDVNGVNSAGIGIEITNWGKLSRTASGGWVSYTGASVASDRVILAKHKHFPGAVHGWEAFDEAQLAACADVASAVVSHFGMQPWDMVGHDDIAPRRKVDPGPAFDMDQFRARVFGMEDDAWDDTRFRVTSPGGLKMRVGAGVSETEIKNLADGTDVHLIERRDPWWLVAEIKDGDDDTTGFVHSNWLMPA